MAVGTRSPLARRPGTATPARSRPSRFRDEPRIGASHATGCAGARLEDLVLSALESISEGSVGRCLVCGAAELGTSGCRSCGSALD